MTVTFLLAQNTNFNFSVVQLLKSAVLYNCDTTNSMKSLALVLIQVQHSALSPHSLFNSFKEAFIQVHPRSAITKWYLDFGAQALGVAC